MVQLETTERASSRAASICSGSRRCTPSGAIYNVPRYADSPGVTPNGVRRFGRRKFRRDWAIYLPQPCASGIPPLPNPREGPSASKYSHQMNLEMFTCGVAKGGKHCALGKVNDGSYTYPPIFANPPKLGKSRLQGGTRWLGEV